MAQAKADEFGEVMEPELPGMPGRPAPLWGDDSALGSGPVRQVTMSLSGTIDLVSSEPGHHVLAGALKPGGRMYLECEAVVSKRGVNADGDGTAAVKLTSAVRSDEAGVLELEVRLSVLAAHHRELARQALAVLRGIESRLPSMPHRDAEGEPAQAARSLLSNVDALRFTARGAVAE